ncbi:uncharacterized protein LOC133562096 [Nerophis ophidion]|uniref:uncharacterized protein LOC133562096 n=1 Tax=Nerophis ophidion TaxID=159077 RepID=UPI002AE081EE|nr:uncharacterized protein LOC133562096 [Nerophis ophidion]
MRLFTCWLMLLPLVTAASIRAPRENVLSFLNDALGAATEKAISENMTAPKKPPIKPEEEDSQDVSDDQSNERGNQHAFAEPGLSDANLADVSRDDSFEVPQTKEVVQPLTGRQVEAAIVDVTSMASPDPQSNEHVDLDSEEDGVRVAAVQGPEKASPAGLSLLGQSGELHSLEESNVRPAAVVRQMDYDETREFVSSETHPIAKYPVKSSQKNL